MGPQVGERVIVGVGRGARYGDRGALQDGLVGARVYGGRGITEARDLYLEGPRVTCAKIPGRVYGYGVRALVGNNLQFEVRAIHLKGVGVVTGGYGIYRIMSVKKRVLRRDSSDYAGRVFVVDGRIGQNYVPVAKILIKGAGAMEHVCHVGY